MRSCLVLFLIGTSVQAQSWQRLPDLPNRDGVAGGFAGVSHGALLVAGGANFPEKKPWEGGQKVWHDAVYVLEPQAKEWKVAGQLPMPLGYGVSGTYREQLYCVGGSQSAGTVAEVQILEWRHGKLATKLGPKLPKPLANSCGTVVGDFLYVAGGQVQADSTSASRQVYRLQLSLQAATWEECPPLPGAGRILAVAACHEQQLLIFGGASLQASPTGVVTRQYLKDVWSYDSKRGWSQLADIPTTLVASPSPAPVQDGQVLLLGGDDGRQVGRNPTLHEGFSPKIQRYLVKANTWNSVGEWPGRTVTAPVVPWQKGWVVVSGETKPGIRTPQVWQFNPVTKP